MKRKVIDIHKYFFIKTELATNLTSAKRSMVIKGVGSPNKINASGNYKYEFYIGFLIFTFSYPRNLFTNQQ